jgi:hypothetical protein
MFNNFFPPNRASYEIISKNVVQPERPQTTTWRMCIACWISKATRGGWGGGGGSEGGGDYTIKIITKYAKLLLKIAIKC